MEACRFGQQRATWDSPLRAEQLMAMTSMSMGRFQTALALALPFGLVAQHPGGGFI